MSIESQFQDDDVITEPQVEETDTELAFEGDFIRVHRVTNPFASAQFIEAMYGELFSQCYRPNGPLDLPVDYYQPPVWLKPEDMRRRDQLLFDFHQVRMGVEGVQVLGWANARLAPSAPEHLPKLRAIGELLYRPFTEETWARVYALYDTARKQRRRGRRCTTTK